ncbi:MAG: hypothetical protein ABH952_00575 [Candidatus Omnitrophota bacterium]
MNKLTRTMCFKAIAIILINAFLCLDIAWAGGGDLKGLSTHLGPSLNINGRALQENFKGRTTNPDHNSTASQPAENNSTSRSRTLTSSLAANEYNIRLTLKDVDGYILFLQLAVRILQHLPNVVTFPVIAIVILLFVGKKVFEVASNFGQKENSRPSLFRSFMNRAGRILMPAGMLAVMGIILTAGSAAASQFGVQNAPGGVPTWPIAAGLVVAAWYLFLNRQQLKPALASVGLLGEELAQGSLLRAAGRLIPDKILVPFQTGPFEASGSNRLSDEAVLRSIEQIREQIRQQRFYELLATSELLTTGIEIEPTQVEIAAELGLTKENVDGLINFVSRVYDKRDPERERWVSSLQNMNTLFNDNKITDKGLMLLIRLNTIVEEIIGSLNIVLLGEERRLITEETKIKRRDIARDYFIHGHDFTGRNHIVTARALNEVKQLWQRYHQGRLPQLRREELLSPIYAACEQDKERLQNLQSNIQKGIIESEEHLEIIGLLLEIEQNHLFYEWDEPGEKDWLKKMFLDQIISIDNYYPGGLRAYRKNVQRFIAEAKKARDAQEAQEDQEIKSPFAEYRIDVPKDYGEVLSTIDEIFMNVDEEGLKIANKTRTIILGGGIGTRFGYTGIKLGVPLALITGEDYLKHHVKNIVAKHEKSNELNVEDRKCSIAIMTSEETYGLTTALLEQHDYFRKYGLSKEQFVLEIRKEGEEEPEKFMQQGVPVIANSKGDFCLEETYVLKTAPHGHGDGHLLINKLGLLEKWEDEGDTHVMVVQDTNPQLHYSAAAAMGVTNRKGYDINFMTVDRMSGAPEGAIVLLRMPDGSATVVNVEYHILDEVLKATGHPEGDTPDPETGFSPYGCNLNAIIMSIDFLKEAYEETNGIFQEMFNFKTQDPRSDTYDPSLNLRSEAAIQDVAYYIVVGGEYAAGFTHVPRLLGFSPAKNRIALGIERQENKLPSETMAMSEADNYRANRFLLDLAGVEIDVEGEIRDTRGIKYPHGAKVSIGGIDSLQEFLAKIEGGSISDGAALVIDDQRRIKGMKNMELRGDGALRIGTVPGVELTIDGLIVENAGWELKDLDDEEMYDESSGRYAEEYLRIRGYKLVKHEALEIEITDAGEYKIWEDGMVTKKVDGRDENIGIIEGPGVYRIGADRMVRIVNEEVTPQSPGTLDEFIKTGIEEGIFLGNAKSRSQLEALRGLKKSQVLLELGLRKLNLDLPLVEELQQKEAGRLKPHYYLANILLRAPPAVIEAICAIPELNRHKLPTDTTEIEAKINQILNDYNQDKRTPAEVIRVMYRLRNSKNSFTVTELQERLANNPGAGELYDESATRELINNLVSFGLVEVDRTQREHRYSLSPMVKAAPASVIEAICEIEGLNLERLSDGQKEKTEQRISEVFEIVQSEKIKQYTENTTTIIVAGASGVGKSAHMEQLVKEQPDEFVIPLKTTTRQARIDDKSVEYLSEEKFRELRANGELGMVRESYGHWYGYRVSEIIRACESGKILLLDTSSGTGVRLIKMYFPEAKVVGMHPVSFEEFEGMSQEQQEQLFADLIVAKTGFVPEEEWGARVQVAIDNYAYFAEHADKVVINKDGEKEKKYTEESYREFRDYASSVRLIHDSERNLPDAGSVKPLTTFTPASLALIEASI